MKEVLACPIHQWAGFRAALRSDRWEISGIVLALLPALLLAAPAVGFLCALLGLSFGWGAWAAVTAVSVLLTIPIRQYFRISSWKEAAGLLILLGGIVAAYASVNLSPESGSPATAVWYKSLDLINGGHLYRDMPWLAQWIGAGVAPAGAYEEYGALVSGAQYTFGNLHFMGLPGGAWFFAWWGMIARPLLFIAPLMLMLGLGVIVNRLLHHALPAAGWPTRALLALILLAMPVYLYFGRGMDPALYALPLFGLALLLLFKTEWACGPYPAVLVAALSLPILCGTDFILPFLVGVLLLTWHKPAWGLGLLITGSALFYGLSVAEPLWFGQVTEMPVYVRGLFFFALGFYLGGLALYRFFSKENAEKWARSALVCLLFYAGILGAMVFLFINHGFGALTLAFSGVVLMAGLLTFPAVLRRHEWPLIFRLMAAGLFVSQLIFFRERPIAAMYADYAPYVALILPLIWLSFSLWTQKARGWPRYLVLGALLVLMAAQSAGARLLPMAPGPGRDMQAFLRDLKGLRTDPHAAVAYDPTVDQGLVPLLWYSGLAPAPILQGGEIDVLDRETGDWLYLTSHPEEVYRTAGDMAYAYLPPIQGALPDGERTVRAEWSVLDKDDILSGIRAEGIVYPSLAWRAEGADTINSTHVRCFGLSVSVGNARYILIEQGFADDLTAQGLEVFIDGRPLVYAGKDLSGMTYCFALPPENDTISAVDIYVGPVTGADMAEGDVREAGLHIADIRLAEDIPDTVKIETE